MCCLLSCFFWEAVVSGERLFKGICAGLSVTCTFGVCQTSTVLAEDEKGIDFVEEMTQKIKEAPCWVVSIDRLLSLARLRVREEFIVQWAFQSIIDSPSLICIVGSGILQFGASVLWDSYKQLNLRSPEKLGERLKFNGYELVAVNYIYRFDGSHYLVWMTKSRDGKPVFLNPSGVVPKEEDEHTVFCGPVGLAVEEIRTLLPGMYNIDSPSHLKNS